MVKPHKLSVTVIAIGLLGGLAWYWSINISEKRNARTSALAKQEVEGKARFERWAYVAKEKELAPGETLRLVIIPHVSGIGYLDTKCLIYTNKEHRASSFLCPNASQDGFEESE